MIAIQTPVAKQELGILPASVFQNVMSNTKATAAPAAQKVKYPFPSHVGTFGIAARNYKPELAKRTV